MAVAVDQQTVVKGLWQGHGEGPSMLSNGRFLHLTFDGGKAAGMTTHSHAPFGVSCFAFHPADETQAVLGTTQGILYGISLRENKLFLLSHLGDGQPIRSVAFCGPGTASGSAHVAVVSERNVVTFLDWQSAAVLHQMKCGAHERAITAIGTSLLSSSASAQAPHSQCVLLMSADAVSCWIPWRSPRSQQTIEHYSYSCIGNAVPLQCAMAVKEASEAPFKATPSKEKASAASPPNGKRTQEPHRFLSVHVHKAHLYTLETNGILAKWSVPPEAFSYPNTTSSLRLERAVQTLPFRPSCASCCSAFLALGCKDTAAVALVDTDTMAGLGVFQISLNTTDAATHSAAARHAHVTQLAIVGAELVCCTLSDGRVMGVAASTHQAVFLLQPPVAGIPHPFCAPLAWRFVPSGPTYGAFAAVSGDVVLVHLPTARAYYDRCVALYAANEDTAVNPFHVRSSLRDAPARGEQETADRDDSTDVFRFTVKVMPFLTERRERSDRQAKKPEIGSSSTYSAPQHPSTVAFKKRFPRQPLTFPAKGTSGEGTSSTGTNPRETWIDVNAAAADSTRETHGAHSTCGSREDNRSLSVLARGLYSDTLSDAACAFNMAKLREFLSRYGVFPSDYRPAIWRFVLGLPDKKCSAAQYAALARRPLHHCVATQMEPFPLDSSTTRLTMEACLSVLAHQSPVFAMAHFTPAFVFPLIHVFSHRDPQSIVEVLLVFFQNWGRDFFLSYPQPPPPLMHFMHRQLSALDPELATHLESAGCGPEVWCWQVMGSFYTDVLTGAEWCQVMDHAFMMEPMWLFMFHLALLQLHRTKFLRDGDGLVQILDILSSSWSQQHVSSERDAQRATGLRDAAHPSGKRGDRLVASAIERAYALYRKCPRDVPYMSSYFDFRSLEGPAFLYPTAFPVDEEVMQTKLMELQHREAQREEEAHAQDQLTQRTREAEQEAIREEVLLHQQRAKIAAKYDAASETWRARVALEKARQHRDAKERQSRLEALRKRVTSAEELERIREQMDAVEGQGRHDLVDHLVEQHKWSLASGITAAELNSLERDAEERVAAGLRRLVDTVGQAAVHINTSGIGDATATPATTMLTDTEDSYQEQRPQGELPLSAAGSQGTGGQETDLTDAEGNVVTPRGGDVETEQAESNRRPTPPATNMTPRYQEAEKAERPYLENNSDAGTDPMDYHNHEEYPVHEDLESFPYQRPVSHNSSEEYSTNDGDDDAEAPVYHTPRESPETPIFGSAHNARSAPLPSHLAPFIPSAELLKALDRYRRPGDSGLAEQRECRYPYDRPRFQPDTHSVVNPFREQLEQLRAQSRELSVPPPLSSPRGVDALPSPLRERLAAMERLSAKHSGHGRRRHPLYDNFSDTTTTRSPTVTTTTSCMTHSETRTSETTSRTGTSVPTTETFTTSPSGDPYDRREPVPPRRRVPQMHSQTSRTTETVSSSAASALQRPWRDEYYWKPPEKH